MCHYYSLNNQGSVSNSSPFERAENISLILPFADQAGKTLNLTREAVFSVVLQGTQVTTTNWPASPQSCLCGNLKRQAGKKKSHLIRPKGLEGRLAATLTKSPAAEKTCSRQFLLSLTSTLPLSNRIVLSPPRIRCITCHPQECLQV